jgi:hypothetical protein
MPLPLLRSGEIPRDLNREIRLDLSGVFLIVEDALRLEALVRSRKSSVAEELRSVIRKGLAALESEKTQSYPGSPLELYTAELRALSIAERDRQLGERARPEAAVSAGAHVGVVRESA